MSRTAADLELIANSITNGHWFHIARDFGVTTAEAMEDALVGLIACAAYVEWDEAGRRGRPQVKRFMDMSPNELTDFLELVEEEEDDPKEQPKPSSTKSN